MSLAILLNFLCAQHVSEINISIIRSLRLLYAGVVSGLQPGHYSSLTAPNLQPTANQERNDQCGNQHYSHDLLMISIVVTETF